MRRKSTGDTETISARFRLNKSPNMRNRRCIGIKVQNIFHVEETRLLLLFLNARKTGFHAQKLEMQVNKFVQHFHYKVLLQPQSAE